MPGRGARQGGRVAAAPDPGAQVNHPAPLPVVLLGGCLGAGKTTLVNHLLRGADGRRLAVLVNDFGDTPIDADLIAAHQPDADGVLTLAGGCLCCSFGDDLVGTLGRIAACVPAPDLVVVELSGVAEPAPVARTLALQPRVRHAATWVVADLARIRRLAEDLYLGDVVQAQLQAADWLLLNKPDLADAATREAVPGWLAGLAPAARQLDGPVQALPAALLLDAALADPAPPAGAGAGPGHAGSAATDAAEEGDAAARFADRPLRHGPPAQPAALRFEHRAWPLPEGTDLAALGAALARDDSGVLRAKALARDAQGRVWLLQVAGPQWQVQPADGVTGPSRLVLIGRRGALPAAEADPIRALTA